LLNQRTLTETKNEAIEVKSDNFQYRKAGRAIIKEKRGGNREKSNIGIALL
jgi:hypothetical protein